VDDLIRLVDGTKNVLIALAFLFMGFWVTVHPQGIPETLQTQWVTVAMSVGTIYVGGRQVKTALLGTISNRRVERDE
jgi:hypothetical protein